MQHFSSEQWTDFVRKALKPVEAQAMQAHLDNRCEQCTAAQATWSQVTSLAARESAYAPPAAGVAVAKAALKLHALPPRRSIVASLLFDSSNAPAIAGVRSKSTDSRQMLYGFDDYRVDLRFEPNFDTDHAVLVGQILNPAAHQSNLAIVTVALLRGGKILGSARTNEFGEFQLECDLGGRLELQLTLPDGATVKVPMVEPTGEPAQSRGLKTTGSKHLKPPTKTRSNRTRK